MAHASIQESERLQEGDLIFVAQTAENAITQVTTGVNSLAIDHVAIIHRIGGADGPLYVIEAVPQQGVTLTPIDSLMSREQEATFVVGHVADLDVTRSVLGALKYIGRPYDDLYLPGDSAIYCSELVQVSYVDNKGGVVFAPEPMSFSDASGKVTDHWKSFYSHRGMVVPEGEPGTNPGALSRHPRVTIVMRYRP